MLVLHRYFDVYKYTLIRVCPDITWYGLYMANKH